MIKSFNNENGVTIPTVSTSQMMEIDRIAIQETGPNLYQMMENAGRNLALCAIEMLGLHWQNSKIIVLAGSGGNGGGGICAARHLANRNANIKICISNSSKLNEIISFQKKTYNNTSGKEVKIGFLEKENPDLIIDAIIGYGLKSAVTGNALNMIEWANNQAVNKLSLDIPSGVDSTTGSTYGKHIKANRTLTLALPKSGLEPTLTGELYLADIGIPSKIYKMLCIKYSEPFGNKYIVKIK